CAPWERLQPRAPAWPFRCEGRGGRERLVTVRDGLPPPRPVRPTSTLRWRPPGREPMARRRPAFAGKQVQGSRLEPLPRGPGPTGTKTAGWARPPLPGSRHPQGVARGQAVLARRAIEAGQDAERADVVTGRAVFLVGQVRALQRERPGVVRAPDHAGAHQPVAVLLDVLGQ